MEQEYSYDTFHQKSERTYRIIEPVDNDGVTRYFATMAPPVGPALMDEYSIVTANTRMFAGGHLDFLIDGNRFMERSFYLADSTFFDVFDFEVLYGDKSSALTQPNTIIITRFLANKFFGREDVIGEALLSPSGQELLITAVLEDLPENSHLQFDALVSMRTILADEPEFDDRWGSNFLVTYLELIPNADVNKIVEKILTIKNKYSS